VDPADPSNASPDDETGDALRRRLNAAHTGLLRIHKALIDFERARYEREHGPVGGAVEFLQLLIRDPLFAWLRPMSALIVQIDEFVMSKEPTDPADGRALLTQARTLLTPNETGDEFARSYFRAIQESPEIAMLHGEWRRDASSGPDESRA
jgi:hypothetical protein